MKLLIVFTGPELRLSVSSDLRCEAVQDETVYVAVLPFLMCSHSDRLSGRLQLNIVYGPSVKIFIEVI